jgi:hypothetical protein
MKAPISSKNFYRRATNFIATKLGPNPKLPVINPDSENWNAWREYFERHLRWTPVVMRKIIDQAPDKPVDGMTVPTDFPQMFDSSFREIEGWEPPAPKQLERRLNRPTLEELRAKYGPNWGLKVIEHETQAKRAWKSPDWADVKPSDELSKRLAK